MQPRASCARHGAAQANALPRSPGTEETTTRNKSRPVAAGALRVDVEPHLRKACSAPTEMGYHILFNTRLSGAIAKLLRQHSATAKPLLSDTGLVVIIFAILQNLVSSVRGARAAHAPSKRVIRIRVPAYALAEFLFACFIHIFFFISISDGHPGRPKRRTQIFDADVVCCGRRREERSADGRDQPHSSVVRPSESAGLRRTKTGSYDAVNGASAVRRSSSQPNRATSSQPRSSSGSRTGP